MLYSAKFCKLVEDIKINKNARKSTKVKKHTT